jgi:sugar phosphate permease
VRLSELASTIGLPWRGKRVFYGWWIVGSAVLSQYAYSIQFNANYGVYVYTMGAEMGWSRTALSAVQSIGRIPEGIFGIALGPTVDRYGARWIVAIGALAMGLSLIALASIQELWQLYLYRGFLMSAGGVCVGGFASVTIANWFRVKRGRALAISSAGASLGNATLPLITAFMIAAVGWRESWAIQGVAIMLLAIPAVITFRRRPEDMGLRPDGLSAESMGTMSQRDQARERELASRDVSWTRAQALKTSAFWYTAVAYGVISMALTATNLHLFPFLEDLGFSPLLAAAGVSFRGGLAVITAPAWGLAIEYLPMRVAQVVPFMMQGAAVMMFFLFPTPAGIAIGLLLYGLGSGGGGILRESVWAYQFGRISLGAIRTAAYPIEALMSAIGPLAMGLAYDLTGSYSQAWVLLFFSFLIAIGLVQLARRPTPPGVAPSPDPTPTY